MGEKLGIGLIGAGLIGTLHSISLRMAIDRLGLPVELSHVADLDSDRRARFKDAFGFGKCSSSWEDLVADDAVDAVFICTWTSEHPAMVKAAAGEKKHVFCEKPLAFDAAEAASMQGCVEAAGVTSQVGLVLRQAPVWNVLRDQLQKGGTGFPITSVFRDDQCFPIKGAHPSEWRKDPARAGHGTIIEHSIHDLDLIEWMMGRVVSVEARTASRFGHPGIEDLAQVSLELESGMTCYLASVWHDVLNRHSNRRIEVFHRDCFWGLESEFTGPIQRMAGEGGLETMSEEEVNARFWELRGMEDPAERELSVVFGAYQDYLFLKAALVGEPADPDFRVAVRAHQLVDACYQSAGAGEPVRL